MASRISWAQAVSAKQTASPRARPNTSPYAGTGACGDGGRSGGGSGGGGGSSARSQVSLFAPAPAPAPATAPAHPIANISPRISGGAGAGASCKSSARSPTSPRAVSAGTNALALKFYTLFLAIIELIEPAVSAYIPLKAQSRFAALLSQVSLDGERYTNCSPKFESWIKDAAKNFPTSSGKQTLDNYMEWRNKDSPDMSPELKYGPSLQSYLISFVVTLHIFQDATNRFILEVEQLMDSHASMSEAPPLPCIGLRAQLKAYKKALSVHVSAVDEAKAAFFRELDAEPSFIKVFDEAYIPQMLKEFVGVCIPGTNTQHVYVGVSAEDRPGVLAVAEAICGTVKVDDYSVSGVPIHDIAFGIVSQQRGLPKILPSILKAGLALIIAFGEQCVGSDVEKSRRCIGLHATSAKQLVIAYYAAAVMIRRLQPSK